MNLKTEGQQAGQGPAMNYEEMTTDELAALLLSIADEVESLQSKLLALLTKTDPIIHFVQEKIEAKERDCNDAEELAHLAEARQMIDGWKYAFNRALDLIHGTGWVTRPVQSIQELAFTYLEEEPAKVESRLAKHLEEAKCASKALYSAICMQNKIRAAKAEAGIPMDGFLPKEALSVFLWNILESQHASKVLVEANGAPQPIEDGTWTEYEGFILRHLADYQHTEVVFSSKALEEGLEIRIGNRMYRLRAR